jgi:predicted Zn-dependent protease
MRALPAGYDARQAISLRRSRRAANKGGRAMEWLSTPPADKTRMADIRAWVPEAMKYYRSGN